VAKFENHPVKFYFDLGLRVTLNTDNRLISNTTLTDEYMLAIKHYKFSIDELKYLILNGFKSAFLPLKEKVELIHKVTDELEKKGLIIKDYI
jgi:adenosine deaminase